MEWFCSNLQVSRIFSQFYSWWVPFPCLSLPVTGVCYIPFIIPALTALWWTHAQQGVSSLRVELERCQLCELICPWQTVPSISPGQCPLAYHLPSVAAFPGTEGRSEESSGKWPLPKNNRQTRQTKLRDGFLWAMLLLCHVRWFLYIFVSTSVTRVL